MARVDRVLATMELQGKSTAARQPADARDGRHAANCRTLSDMRRVKQRIGVRPSFEERFLQARSQPLERLLVAVDKGFQGGKALEAGAFITRLNGLFFRGKGIGDGLRYP